MGTRGIIGVVVDGVVKATYNHFDSYPEGLGLDMIADIKMMLTDKDWGIDKMREQARKLVMVDNDVARPTEEQVEQFNGFFNANTYGDGEGEYDWYNLLRELQGRIMDTLTVGYANDGGVAFAKDSLFCEWGYLINLDTLKLEVYRGFINAPHKKGRFALKKGEKRRLDHAGNEGDYYPIALIAEYDLNHIPNDFVKLTYFRSKELYIVNGKKFTDVNKALDAMAVGDVCQSYDVYDGKRDESLRLTRDSETTYIIVDPEDE